VIVISGALVLVALVLLVVGLATQNISFVYGSIAVSLISFVFLVIGILQRRGEQSSDEAPAVTDDGAGSTDGERPAAAPAVSVAKARSAGRVPVRAHADEEELEDDEFEDADLDGPTVLVVPGRPRYHVDGCRYLAGKQVDEVPLDEARGSYSACGVCKPDAVVEAAGPGHDLDDAGDADEVVDSGVPGAEDTEADLAPEPVAPRRSRGRTAGTTAAAPAAAAATAAPARASRSRAKPAAPEAEVAPAPAKASRSRARTAAATASADAPASHTAPAQAPQAAPVKPARRTGRVVVIPDRGRFHVQSCRFVRDALGTEELTRTAAAKQGYQPCGVCRP
jgi:hypothetical protein